MSQSLRIRLRWDDPATGERREPIFELPAALGRDFAQMPAQWQGQRVSRIVFNSSQVSRFHALIVLEAGTLVVLDQNSRNGTFVNGQPQTRCTLANGDTLQIGPYQINVTFAGAGPPPTPVTSQILFNPTTDLPDPSVPPAPVSPELAEFPPSEFIRSQVLAIQDIHAMRFPVDEVDYATVGAGLGSFMWADFLRIYGVKTHQIAALGMEPEPYARYRRLCLNSQIPLHERLRSNSDSCPDNIWGWPSYALREAWHDFLAGKLGSAGQYLWQVFAEPTFAQTYTPRAGNVFNSIDREAKRIGWSHIYRYGRVRGIRKTEDGRYAIAYSRSSAQQRDHAFLIARFVHLATGYPAIQFLPDLQAYRQKTGDFKSVVNAYEDHPHVYQQLEQQGGTVLIRGRGIVASRIVQRIYEARQRNPQISLLHLMRSPKPVGNQFRNAKRRVENHYEYQPFNWPKANWGGELREILEKATPQQRQQLLTDWGGTTTANRRDWQQIVQAGLNEGWYKIEFGEVEQVEREGNGVVTYIQEKGFKGQVRLAADFIIDATGLDAHVISSPLLKDLVECYQLPLNHLGRLTIANNFELVEMRNGTGRIYAAGAITLGGPYAPVDSFLGLQYSALRSVESLATHKAPHLHHLHPFSSLGQWCKWALNQSPS
jgi:pSer/pThr/pTyr-binding forkhead associated (FHA) protein